MRTTGYVLLHLAPLLPLVTRGVLVLRYRRAARRQPPEAAMERDVGRGFSLSLAGFSFAVVVALALVPPGPPPLPLYLAFVSSLAFLAAAGLEGRKATIRGDMAAGGLREAGVLSLLLGLIVLLYAADLPVAYRYGLPALGFGVWLWDHGATLRLNRNDLRKRDAPMRRDDDLDRRPRQGPEETKDANWTSCPKHGTRFRRGDTCTECEREAAKRE